MIICRADCFFIVSAFITGFAAAALVSNSLPSTFTDGCWGDCPACHLHPASFPTLYVAGRNDGAGSTLINLVQAVAFAHHNGYNFGGSISCRNRVKHSFSIDAALEFMLGASDLVHDSFLTSVASGGAESDLSSSEVHFTSLQQAALTSHGAFVVRKGRVTPVHLATSQLVQNNESGVDTWFDSSLVSAFRSGVSCRVQAILAKAAAESATTTDEDQNATKKILVGSAPKDGLLASAAAAASDTGGERRRKEKGKRVRVGASSLGYFSKGAVSVAMHVRRGDVHETDAQRFDADERYYRLAALLQTSFKKAEKDLIPTNTKGGQKEAGRGAMPTLLLDIHVFSSTEGGAWKSEDFDGYRARNMTVHLNGDPKVAWAHFLAADLLVTARSSFSGVAAHYRRHTGPCPSLSVAAAPLLESPTHNSNPGLLTSIAAYDYFLASFSEHSGGSGGGAPPLLLPAYIPPDPPRNPAASSPLNPTHLKVPSEASVVVAVAVAKAHASFETLCMGSLLETARAKKLTASSSPALKQPMRPTAPSSLLSLSSSSKRREAAAEVHRKLECPFTCDATALETKSKTRKVHHCPSLIS